MIKNYFRILKNPHAYFQAILKAHVKFQKDRPKTVGGVKGTRYLLPIHFCNRTQKYLLPIHFCNIRTQKMSKFKIEKSEKKNNFRILKKPHAYLQTILKAPVKFQKDRIKTVGGVKGTRYLLKIRNHALRATHHAKPKTVSLRFSSKRRGTTRALQAEALYSRGK